MEISEIFSADPKSVWKVLCEPGSGFYVPAYQRAYTWNKSNIERLFDDSALGLSHLINSQDAITFIGTLISIHDTKYQTVQPHIQGELPARVMLIIDGQQRLTTLLLVNAVISEESKILSKRFEKKDEPHFKWLTNETRKLKSELESTYSIDMTYGDAGYQFYPQMVRAYEDSWSRSSETAKYESPIARYLHGYISYWLEGANTKPYVHEVDADSSGAHKIIIDNVKTIRSIVRRAVCKNDHPDINLPDIEEILLSEDVQRTLFNTIIPASVVGYIRSSEEGQLKEKFNQLFRLVVFSKFLLHRVAVTVVTAKNEDYAFDMFEALNTTGEPLTAFETFKPKVIQAENITEYETSTSRKYIQHIEEYLEQYKKAQDKQQATTELMIPFSLAETGLKLSKRLSDQRKYLRDEFDSLDFIDKKREFVQHLSHCAIFIKEAWPDRADVEPQVFGLKEEHKDEVLLCLDVLRKSKHTIAIGILVRYFSKMRKLSGDERDLATVNFVKIAKGLTAFFVIWRGSRISTSGIDSHYRKIVKDGFEAAGLTPLCHRGNDGQINELPEPHLVLGALREILRKEGGVANLDDWVKKTNSIPIYSVSTPVARFLLLAASHDSTPDESNPGLLKSARIGHLSLLNYKAWKHVNELEVEHVAPCNPAGGWSESIYEESENVHRIGNLTLAPKIENIVLGNRPWSEKRILYKVLSSSTTDELEDLMGEAHGVGVDLTTHSEQILKESKYLPHVQSVSAYNAEWDVDIINRRGERLLGLAWDKISCWLGY